MLSLCRKPSCLFEGGGAGKRSSLEEQHPRLGLLPVLKPRDSLAIEEEQERIGEGSSQRPTPEGLPDTCGWHEGPCALEPASGLMAHLSSMGCIFLEIQDAEKDNIWWPDLV